MAFRFLLFIIATVSCFSVQLSPSVAQSLVIRDASILTMVNDDIQDNQTVIIEEGIIQWLGNADDAEIPENAIVVEESYYVIPGLSEMHAHIPQPGQGEQVMKDALMLYLSQGITTIRGMLGHPAHLELREKAAAGGIVSPRIFTSGPSFSGGSVDSPEQARRMVRQQAETGYDLLKFHPGLTVDQFNAITEEANRLGIKFSGHISHDVGLERSLNAGQGTIDHLDRYMEFLAGNPEERDDPSIIFFGYDLAYDVNEDRIAEAARMTEEAGVWNVPTHTLLDNVFNPDLSVEMMREWPGMEYVSGATRDNWSEFIRNLRTGNDFDADKARRFLEVRDQLLIALHEAGAGLMLGADAPQIFNPAGFSAHRELLLYVDAGLTPFEALKTGTVNVASYLGESGSSGVIAPGSRADLVLLSSNPLESIPFHDQIEGVISDGKYYDREELDQMLLDIKSRIN
ncbi:amidohydrolase family protein [Rhodohalobacter sp. 8-1]|uniref:amidohydrolase family protein n=1 Tax=Rhodohalobacter sp. 8-1 TaxID=3131972 RepID=UPI0030EEF142